MRTNHPSIAPNYYDQAGNLRSGTRISRTLLTGVENAPDNFRLGYSTGGDDGQWTTPRHHHNFEQVRWAIGGDYSVGTRQKLPEGWVGYFPEAAYYGPQSQSPDLTLLVLQFGGPSGQGYGSVAQRRKGLDDLLAKGGKLENGIYSWVDENGTHHNQDAFEAVWEQMNGRKITYPEPRYDSIILINPDAFAWTDDAASPGVHRRRLGTFTERDVKIGFVRLDEGAALPFGTEPSNEILFLASGAVGHGGDTHPALTAFGSSASEAAETLTALEPSELLYVKLPTF
jgi:hypothetical protein